MPDHITIYGDPQGLTMSATRVPWGSFGEYNICLNGDALYATNYHTAGHAVHYLLPTDWPDYNHSRVIITGTWTQTAPGIADLRLNGDSDEFFGVGAYYASAPITRDWVFESSGAAPFPNWHENPFTLTTGLPHSGGAADIFSDPVAYVFGDATSYAQSYVISIPVSGQAQFNAGFSGSQTATFVMTRAILQLWKTIDPGLPGFMCIGDCGVFNVTPGAGSGTSGSWIVTDPSTVASSGTPNGWSVSYSSGVLTVCAPCGATAETVTVTYQIDSTHRCSIQVTLEDCSLCGTPGGGTGSGINPPGAIESHSERSWLFLGGGTGIKMYSEPDLGLLLTSGAYSVDGWLRFRYDRRYATLLMVGISGSSVKVFQSTDGGNTGTVKLSVTANTAVLETQSERGRTVLIYGDGSDHCNFVESKDGGDTWSSPAQVKMSGSQLVAKLIDCCYDYRLSTLFMTCQISGSTKVLRSTDGGETFETVL